MAKKLISVRIEESLLDKIESLAMDPSTRSFKIERTLKKGLRLM